MDSQVGRTGGSSRGTRSPVIAIGDPKRGKSKAASVPSRSPKAADNAAQTASESSAEKILCDVLFAAKASVIKGSAAKESAYALERILPFIPQRARESVEQEVSKVIVKLIDLRGPSPHHRMVAYSNVGDQLIAEIDSMIYNTDSEKLKDLQHRFDQLKSEKESMHTNMSQIVAAKDIENARLKDQQHVLNDQLQSMSQENTNLQLELEKLLRDRIQTHQHSVELRMQGLDFKAEVDRRSGNIMSSVQTRMGFVPVGIEKQLELLRALKAPGDPSYDQVRQFRSMKIPNVDAESYVSGAGSGSEFSSNGRARSSPRSPMKPSNYLNGGGSHGRPSPTGRPGSKGDFTSFSGDSDLVEDWELDSSPTSPIRNSTGIGERAKESDHRSRNRPTSAPSRRLSPREQGLSPRERTQNLPSGSGSGNEGGEKINIKVVAPPLHSPTMLSPVVTNSKTISGIGGTAAAGADSANIVLKLRSRNLDSWDTGRMSKSSPSSGNGINFNTLNGHVTKSGSPVRGVIAESPRHSIHYSQDNNAEDIGDMSPSANGKKVISVPTAILTEKCSGDDDTDLIFRERRSSSGATSTGYSNSSGEAYF